MGSAESTNQAKPACGPRLMNPSHVSRSAPGWPSAAGRSTERAGRCLRSGPSEKAALRHQAFLAGDGLVEFEQTGGCFLQAPERRGLIEQMKIHSAGLRGSDLRLGPAKQHGVGPSGGGSSGQRVRKLFHQRRRVGQHGWHLLRDAVGGTKRVGVLCEGVGKLTQHVGPKFGDLGKGLGHFPNGGEICSLRREQIQSGLAVRCPCRPTARWLKPFFVERPQLHAFQTRLGVNEARGRYLESVAPWSSAPVEAAHGKTRFARRAGRKHPRIPTTKRHLAG